MARGPRRFKTFNVRLYREMRSSEVAYATVQARTQEEAEQKAEEIVADGADELDWSFVDGETLDAPTVDEVEEVK